MIKTMAFAVPMVWREPKNHLDDCYFCIILPIKPRLSMKKRVQHPIFPYIILHIPHSDGLPVPTSQHSYKL